MAKDDNSEFLDEEDVRAIVREPPEEPAEPGYLVVGAIGHQRLLNFIDAEKQLTEMRRQNPKFDEYVRKREAARALERNRPKLTEEQANRLREYFLKTWPELRAWFSAQDLIVGDDGVVEPPARAVHPGGWRGWCMEQRQQKLRDQFAAPPETGRTNTNEGPPEHVPQLGGGPPPALVRAFARKADFQEAARFDEQARGRTQRPGFGSVSPKIETVRYDERAEERLRQHKLTIERLVKALAEARTYLCTVNQLPGWSAKNERGLRNIIAKLGRAMGRGDD